MAGEGGCGQVRQDGQHAPDAPAGAAADQAFAAHALQHFLSAAVKRGTPPFALAAVDGGRDTYWHRRADGDDPQAMLLEEFLPMLTKQGLRTDSFGVTGWSMGGYG